MTRASGCEPVILESDGAGDESARAMRAALAAGDLDRADAMAASLGPIDSLGAEARKALADLHLRRQRWIQAADTLALIEPRHAGIEMQWRLARNFADLQQHRPAVYRTLTTASRPTSNCQPAISPSGAPTLAQTLPGGRPVVLTPGGDPSIATPQIVAGLSDDLKRGRCLALCGIGDGYLLTHLAANPPQLQLGQQQCIHLIEPHPEVLLAAMMIHDWSGPTGPIQDRRFQWWIGEAWSAEIHEALERDPYLPYPERPVRLSLIGDEIDATLREVLGVLIEGEKRLAARVEKKYAGFTPRFVKTEGESTPRFAEPHGESTPRFAEPHGESTPRFAEPHGESTPRFAEPHRGRGGKVLLLTTRFSTVLQHSTRDLAAAFEQAGWATRLPIEPSPYHRNSRRNLLRHLADFQPDLIVQIDHLRHEHGDLFPPQAPFVCWIQDDLPNLTRREAGAAIGPRDFVLTTSQAVYVNDYGYPERQCIYMPKATRLPDLDGLKRVEAPDVVYVSNASQTVDVLVDQLADEHASQPAVAQLIRAVSRHLRDAYARGECVYTIAEVHRVLLEQAGRLDLRMTDDGAFAAKMAARLFATVNNALYRQQALEWAAGACERVGLSLGLYGAGWESHPRFSRFARGSVAYGQDLEVLTRSAKVNLQIVPYMFLHQRWLDGIAAGGFFLIRAHPMDTLAADVAAFIDGNLDSSIGTLAQALLAVQGETKRELENLVARRLAFDDHRGTDPIALYRQHKIEGRDYIYRSPAHLHEVRFADESSLSSLLAQFGSDPQRRTAVMRRQREYVAAHYTYSACLRRVLARVADLLADEASQTHGAADGAAEGVATCV